MQDQHHPIDQKFKDIEKSASPDLSNIDTHWQALQKDLVPSNTNPGRPKKFRWIYGPILLALLVPFIIIFSKKSPERNDSFREEMISEKPTQEDTIPVRPSQTKKIGPTSGTNKLDTVSPPFVLVNSTTKEAKRDTIYLSSKPPRPPKDTLKIFTKPVPIKTKKVIQIKARTSGGKDTVLDAIIVEEKKETTRSKAVKAIESFYQELQKPAQSFVIKPTIDNLVTRQEGTRLVISAGSFATTHPETLSLMECYSYPDIICNQIVTIAGHQPLNTGGMIHLEAIAATKPILLMQGKFIKWQFPNKTASPSGMKLFYGNIVPVSSSTARTTNDIFITAGQSSNYHPINWQPVSPLIDSVSLNPAKPAVNPKRHL